MAKMRRPTPESEALPQYSGGTRRRGRWPGARAGVGAVVGTGAGTGGADGNRNWSGAAAASKKPKRAASKGTIVC